MDLVPNDMRGMLLVVQFVEEELGSQAQINPRDAQLVSCWHIAF
jgi:hypothetical protein